MSSLLSLRACFRVVCAALALGCVSFAPARADDAAGNLLDLDLSKAADFTQVTRGWNSLRREGRFPSPRWALGGWHETAVCEFKLERDVDDSPYIAVANLDGVPASMLSRPKLKPVRAGERFVTRFAYRTTGGATGAVILRFGAEERRYDLDASERWRTVVFEATSRAEGALGVEWRNLAPGASNALHLRDLTLRAMPAAEIGTGGSGENMLAGETANLTGLAIMRRGGAVLRQEGKLPGEAWSFRGLSEDGIVELRATPAEDGKGAVLHLSTLEGAPGAVLIVKRDADPDRRMALTASFRHRAQGEAEGLFVFRFGQDAFVLPLEAASEWTPAQVEVVANPGVPITLEWHARGLGDKHGLVLRDLELRARPLAD